MGQSVESRFFDHTWWDMDWIWSMHNYGIWQDDLVFLAGSYGAEIW